MPDIKLPSRGEKPYDTRLNAAIMEINAATDEALEKARAALPNTAAGRQAIATSPEVAAAVAGAVPAAVTAAVTQDGPAKDALDATIGAAVADVGVGVFVPVGLPSVQPFLQKIKQGINDVFWTHVGDSIDAGSALWVGRLAQWLAAEYPTHTFKFRIWQSGTNVYSGWSTLSTGSGPRTVWISNGAVPGTATPYAASRMGAMVWATTPDLLTYAYNANEFPHTAAGAATYVGRFLAFTEDVLRGSSPSIVYVAKPPRPANPGGVEYRVDAARSAVQAKGFGFIDFMQAFLDYGANYATALYDADAVHPNTAGQDIMLAVARRAFSYAPGVAGPAQSPSSFTPPLSNILTNGFFADWTGASPAGWNVSTNATVTKDTTNFETGSYGLRIEPTDPTVASAIFGIEIPATRFRGQYVTVATRVLAPWGRPSAAGLGRIGLTTGAVGQTQQGSAEVDTDAGFQWRVVTIRIPTDAPVMRVILEARATYTGSGDWATYDRVILAPGILPRDAIPGLVT